MRKSRTRRTRSLRLERLEDRSLLAAIIGPHVPDARSEIAFADKIGPVLAELHFDWIEHYSSATLDAGGSYDSYSATKYAAEVVPHEKGFVALDAVAYESATAVRKELLAIGFEEIASIGRVVSGYLPIGSLDDLAAIAGIKFASPASLVATNVGATMSQGDVLQRTDALRSLFELSGDGIRVGVISDTWNSVTTDATSAADDIASGDLPSNVLVLHNDRTLTAGDEGRAMAQIVYDIAPGASQAFSSVGNPLSIAPPHAFQTQFANRILELAKPTSQGGSFGADIIVDDWIVRNAPMFQDGFVAQAVNEVASNGVIYVTSAANFARNSYESEFRPGPLLTTVNGQQETAHIVDPATGSYRQRITVPNGAGMQIDYQWDSPFFSLGGAGSSTDVNIYIFVAGTNTLVAPTFSPRNNVGLDPVDSIVFANTTNYGTNDFDVVITHRGGPAPGRIKYYYDDNSSGVIFDSSTFTYSSTIIGHANAAGAITVGASDYRTPSVLESFSSAGGTPILFDTAGNRLLTPIVRQKPDIVGPDNANTTFFVTSGGDPENDGFPNFAGTSASAPHVAGLVALLLEASPNLTPEEIRGILTSTSIDMDDPFTSGFDAGFDFGTGYGFVDGVAAITKVLADSLPPKVMDVVISSSTAAEHAPYALTRAAGSGAQLLTVPVGNIDAIDIVFSEMVTVDAIDLLLTGLAKANRPTAYTFTPPSLANGFTARWSFDNPATTTVVESLNIADFYLITLDSAAIRDANNNALDGEWTNPGKLFATPGGIFTNSTISRFPSGDGNAGGDFNFVISILPGDANQNLMVDLDDFNTVFANFFLYVTSWQQGNVNGDGQVNLDDFNIVFANFMVPLGLVRLSGDVDDDGIVSQTELDLIATNENMLNAEREDGDVDGDGDVDLDDYNIAATQFNLVLTVVI